MMSTGGNPTMGPNPIKLHSSLVARLAFAILAVLALGLGPACSTESAPESAATVDVIHDLPVQGPVEGHELGQQSPEFKLRLANGETLTLTQIRESDRPAFLFFWATT